MADAKHPTDRSRRLAALWDAIGLKVAGLGMMLALLTVIGLSLASFAGHFQSTATVLVEAPRSGLVLDIDAKVKLRGVEIGRVGAVEYRDDRAILRLDMDPDHLRLVPADARVDIRSTTVFGAKYIDFVAPPGRVDTPLRPGAVVRAESVTVEFDTLFQRLATILAQVQPDRLNATLEALGTALSGRGATLGDLLSRSDAYLAELNPSLPTVRRDLVTASRVTEMYADTSGDLLRTLDNTTVTGATVADSANELDDMLLGVVGLGETGGAVLAENERSLATALDLLRPTSELLREYAPGLGCVIDGIAAVMPLAEYLFGGGPNPWLAFNTNFLIPDEPYQYPNDLPKVAATGGPRCEGVADRVPGSHADFVVTDTNQGTPFVPPTRFAPADGRSVFELLFAGVPSPY